MNWLTEDQIKKFMEHYDYDIRKTGNARWIDQKCTPHVLSIIADCILEFSNSSSEEWFSSLDIWHNEYTIQNVESIFKKPNPDEQKARNEYDKFFQQPMEMFANAGILWKKKVGNKNYYKLWNKMLLEFISIREMNALKFLELYNTKVLKDSGIYKYFEDFFNNPTNDTYEKMKQELRPLKKINNSFKKVLITKYEGDGSYDEDGILHLNLFDFLLDDKSLD